MKGTGSGQRRRKGRNTPEQTESVESERMCSVVWTTQECQSEWREEAKQRRQHPEGCCGWVGFGSGSREGGEDRPKNTGARRFLVKQDFKEYEKGCEGRV